MTLRSVIRYFSDGEKITPFRSLIILIWCSTPILYYFSILAGKYSFAGIKGDVLIPIVFVLLIFKSRNEILKRIKGVDIIVYIFAVIYLVLSMAFFPQNGEYIGKGLGNLIFSLFPYYFAGLLIDIHKFKNTFFLLSVLSIFSHFLFHFWYTPQKGPSTHLTEDIVGAYNILLHVIYLTWYAFSNKKILSIILAVFAALFLLSMGNRGSILCYIIFIFLNLSFNKNSTYKTWRKMFLVLLGTCFILFYDKLASYFSEIFFNLGMSNRVFDLMLSNEFLLSAGRDDIRTTLLGAVGQGPFWGYGIFGDRYLLQGGYAHNFYLELIVDFGYLPGLLILIALFVLCFRAFYKAQTSDELSLFFIFISVFMGLFFSGSFLTDYSLYMLVGYSMNIIRRNRYHKIC